MRATCKVLLVLGLAAVLTGPALAQGQRKGGGFGRGGFGGGPGQLIRNKSVQQELKLTDDQVKKGETVAKEVNDKHQSDREALRDLEGQERGQKMMEINRTVNEETYKALADVLKPEQVKRLKQIQLQRQGTFAFMSPDTQKELKLTDDQKDKIKTIGDDARQEMQSIFQPGGDQQEMRKKMAAFQKETMEKITAVLTDDQKKTWKEMAGEPFEYKPDPNEGFGGRRGKKKDGV